MKGDSGPLICFVSPSALLYFISNRADLLLSSGKFLNLGNFFVGYPLTGMPVKVTGGDCQEMLKLLPLGVNFVDPGMFTGGVACLKRKRYSSIERPFKDSVTP